MNRERIPFESSINVFDAFLGYSYSYLFFLLLQNPGERKTSENARILAKSVKHSTDDIGLCSKGGTIKQNVWLISFVSFFMIFHYLSKF